MGNIESRRMSIDELQLYWSDESEDNTDVFSVSPHRNQTNVLNQLLTRSNDQLFQDYATSHEDELNTVKPDAYRSVIEINVHQNSTHALNDLGTDWQLPKDQEHKYVNAVSEHDLNTINILQFNYFHLKFKFKFKIPSTSAKRWLRCYIQR